MANLEKSIQTWLKQFRKHRAFNDASIQEMELHLRDHIEDLIGSGLEEEEAFQKAVEEFGEVKPVAKEEYWAQIRKTKINYAMIQNYIKITFRNFRKHTAFAVVNVFGLTMGLSIVLLIGLYISDELSFDRFHEKKDQLYRVVENQYYSGQPVFPVAVTPVALGPSLVEEYPEILSFTRLNSLTDQFELKGEKITETNGFRVDVGFFEMFSFPLTRGNIEDFKSKLNSLILTEKMAVKYFGEDDPVGRPLIIDDEEFIVVALMEDVPKNSHIQFDYLKNYEKFLAENPDRVNNWSSNSLYTYVELAPGTGLELINEKIIGQIKANNENSVTDIYLQPMLDIYLGEVDFTVEVSRKGEMMYVQIFIVVAIFILLISCINFMNLSTARSTKRAKEVGLRKTVGARRNQLIFQFLSESVIFTLVSLVLAVGIVALLIPSFNQIAGKEFSVMALLDPDFGLKFGLIVLFSAIGTGLIAGSYPALFLSAIDPIHTLSSRSTAIRQGDRLRKGLVILQFSVSVILIIGTMVVYNQLNYIQDVNLGYDREHTMYMFASGTNATSFANEVRGIRGVNAVGRANRHPGYVLSSTSGFDWPGKNPDEAVLIHYMGVDEHYMPAMNHTIIEGRNLFPNDTTALLINEKAKEIIGLDDPLGATITADTDYTIVGVIKDFNFKSIHTAIEPIIIFLSPNARRIYIKYYPNEQVTVASEIENKWNDFFPNEEFEAYYLDTDFNEMYEAEQRTSTLSAYFATLAILISCLGLFGLVAYAVEQRTKEIGIRKTLGASTSSLFLLLTSDFAKLVLISLLIAIPSGWYAMSKWLESFAYRIDLSVWVFVFASIIASLIAFLTVGYQSLKASSKNPVTALRTE